MPGLSGRLGEPEKVEQPAFRKASSTYPMMIGKSQELNRNKLHEDDVENG